MRGEKAVSVNAKVVNGDRYDGETLPTWIGTIRGKPEVLDISAVLCQAGNGPTGRSIRIAVVNRSRDKSYNVPVRLAFETPPKQVEVHEVWHEDVNARNGFGEGLEDNVGVRTTTEKWDSRWTFKEHSFTLLVLDL